MSVLKKGLPSCLRDLLGFLLLFVIGFIITLRRIHCNKDPLRIILPRYIGIIINHDIRIPSLKNQDSMDSKGPPFFF